MKVQEAVAVAPEPWDVLATRLVPLKPPVAVFHASRLRVAGLAVVDHLHRIEGRRSVVTEVQGCEVVAALAGEGVHRRVQRLGLHPVGLHDLGHRKFAGPNTREGVVAAGVGGLGGEHIAAGIEQFERPALQARLARIVSGRHHSRRCTRCPRH